MMIFEVVLRARDQLVARCRKEVDDDSLRVLSRASGRDEEIRSMLWKG